MDVSVSDGELLSLACPNGVAAPHGPTTPVESAGTVLLVATCWWPFVGRFCHLLITTGCKVAILCPKGHVTAVVDGVTRFEQQPLRPLHSLSKAIAATSPLMILPTDDRAVAMLHALHRSGTDAERALVEASIGPAHAYALTPSRVKLLALARSLGIPAPDSAPIANDADLFEWMKQVPGPWVIKVDGVWGGRGVRIVTTAKQARFALARSRRAMTGRAALKRLLINRDPYWTADWLYRSKPEISVQAYVHGRPCTMVMLCLGGKVVAATVAEAIAWEGETGPSTVVRLVDRPDILVDAARLADHLRLTGFYGLDYILEESTGRAMLIEMNPRVTNLANIRLEPGRDLIGALVSYVLGMPYAPPETLPHTDLVAHFPSGWRETTPAAPLTEYFQDVPWEQPALLAEMLRAPWTDRSVLARLELGWIRLRTRFRTHL